MNIHLFRFHDNNYPIGYNCNYQTDFIIKTIFGNDIKYTDYNNCDISIIGDYHTIYKNPTYRNNILHLFLTRENLYGIKYHIDRRIEHTQIKKHFFAGCIQNDINSVFLPIWTIYYKEFLPPISITENNFETRFNNGVCSVFGVQYQHREKILNFYNSNRKNGLIKKDILKNYLFNVCAENSKDPYGFYITEKLPDAIQGGCIPIYWGGDLNHTPFNQDRIINITDLNNMPDISKYSKNQLEDMWNLNPFNCDFEDYSKTLIENAVKKIKDRL